MNFFIMVSLFLSAALGVFRGIDLALLTDAETGLCIVGPVWLRYGALAVAVGAAVAAGRCCKPQAGALRSRCTPSGVVALAAAVCYGEAAVLRILWMHSSVVMLIRAALEALCAFWMIGLGLSWLRRDWKTPTRSLTPAVLGSAVAGWASTICIVCFMGGVQLVCLGVIGEYVGKIYMETKARPRYIISERTWAPYERKYHG